MLMNCSHLILVVLSLATVIFDAAAKQSMPPDSIAPQLMRSVDLEGLGLGGLSREFADVFRRAFASRLMPSSLMKKLGPEFKHAKGILLHGPPGTGKTLLARKIGEMLNCTKPKIVNGPEVMGIWVGHSEKNVRELFAEAVAEEAARGNQSQLHLIIFDEFDAICKPRGTLGGGSGAFNDGMVNQLLSMIDGVNALNNVLLIAMTNRKDLIDPAVLRPGRIEIHIEMGLPDEQGRLDIFQIHTKAIRENNLTAANVDLVKLAHLTTNFSGAEIAGAVRTAISSAISRHVNHQNLTKATEMAEVKVTMSDLLQAVNETPCAFRKAQESTRRQSIATGRVINYGPAWDGVAQQCAKLVQHLRGGSSQMVDLTLTVLVEGAVGCGKSTVAAHLAQLAADFAVVQRISSSDLVAFGETQKSGKIRQVFDNAAMSNASVIVLDDLERLVGYSHIGKLYSNEVLQTLLVLINRPLPVGRRLLVIGTTSEYDVVDSLRLAERFHVHMQLAAVDPSSLPLIVKGVGATFPSHIDLMRSVNATPPQMCIKKLMQVVELSALSTNRVITYDSFRGAILSTSNSARSHAQPRRESSLSGWLLLAAVALTIWIVKRAREGRRSQQPPNVTETTRLS